MKRISALLTSKSNLLWIGVFLILFMLTTSILFPWASNKLSIPQGVEKIDTQQFYSADKFYEIIETYGPAGRSGYAISHFTSDLVFPIVYTLFFGLWIAWALRKILPGKSKWHLLNLTPLALFVFDLMENTLVTILLLTYPSRMNWLASISGFVTAIKWFFSAASVLLAVGATLVMIGKLIFRRNTIQN
ncbi:MAG: hypothetical protein JEZ06_24080 [Anaerolineaceae bacterium]|nr:hypothetical protein [Anaerolineaceae bacterium]